ncbi:MAG: toprim domain-containing protein [Adhaeribacter sp.]
MNIKQINDSIPIIAFLGKLGIQPTHKKGNDWWYISPIRDPEQAPSFKVDTDLNRWYDHGTGEGGKLFDLALRLYKTNTLQETIQRITDLFSFSKATTSKPVILGKLLEKINQPLVNEVDPNSTKVRILDVQPLGQNGYLINYLNQRGIRLKNAKPYCREVSFSIENKKYQAIGFENNSGGFELRNPWFKGSSSPKDFTFLDQGAKSICLLEGFMDFLSLLELRPQLHQKTNFMVLNSVALSTKSLHVLERHTAVFLFLDQDQAGRTTTEKLLNSGINGIDASHFYKDHKDVNELLMARQKQSVSIGRKPGHL